MKPPTITTTYTPQQLLQILTTIPDKPIRLLWDRATWHRGAPIRKILADNPRLEVMAFPITALELNPQEQILKSISPRSQQQPSGAPISGTG
jgi:transposase